MSSEMQKRLYEMEVTPPRAVWEKLSINIDEINEDNRVAKRLMSAELAPPLSVWEKIESTINVVEEKPGQKKGVVINLRRLAVAAALIGVVITAWIILRNNRNATGLAGIENRDQPSTSTNSNTATQNKNPNLIDSPTDPSTLGKLNVTTETPGPIASVSEKNQEVRIRSNNKSPRNKKTTPAEPATAEFASLNEPLGNTFNQPIDDLSLVTSDQNYLTMVNANGRLVKIPTQLASLAPHLQDKPVSEDYYEVLFGEGNYWKETLNEWRKKVASAPMSTGDAFTSLVELLKNVQNR